MQVYKMFVRTDTSASICMCRYVYVEQIDKSPEYLYALIAGDMHVIFTPQSTPVVWWFRQSFH